MNLSDTRQLARVKRNLRDAMSVLEELEQLTAARRPLNDDAPWDDIQVLIGSAQFRLTLANDYARNGASAQEAINE